MSQPYGTPAYGQPAGQPAYGQPVPGQPAYGQPAYGQPAGQPSAPPAYGPPPGWNAGPAAPPTSSAPAGYPAAGYPAPGYPAPGQAGGQQQFGQLAVTSCRLCGSVPAAEAKFRGHQGMLVIMRFLSNEGPFCRNCGLGVFRHMTSRTLVQGWYGYASFIITPITVLMNIVRRGKVANLAEPQPNPYGPSRAPMDPGPRLLQRPMTWIGLAIPFIVIALLITAIANSD